jgi:transposase InsO family protein
LFVLAEPNHKKLLRIYREENLRVRRRGGRTRALGTRAPMVLPDGPNQRWSLDFVSDTLACSRRFRIPRVVDDYTRECLALVADGFMSFLRYQSASRPFGFSDLPTPGDGPGEGRLTPGVCPNRSNGNVDLTLLCCAGEG